MLMIQCSLDGARKTLATPARIRRPARRLALWRDGSSVPPQTGRPRCRCPGLRIGCAVHDPRDTRMQDGANAHGAGLERDVKGATDEAVVRECPPPPEARVSRREPWDRRERSGRYIRPRSPPSNHHGAHRYLASFVGAECELQGLAHDRRIDLVAYSHSIVAGGLPGDVVHHAVDAAHLVDDAVGHLGRAGRAAARPSARS